MDLEGAYMRAMFHLFEGLPRQGPGNDAATADAFSRIPDLPPRPRVIDLGCGSGASTLALARLLEMPVVAVDIHRPLLDDLERSAAEQGLNRRIITRQANMGQLDDDDASFDLIWSEGAAYLLGFGGALRSWRRILKPGGYLVMSECTWLRDDPPEEFVAYWGDLYPTMGTIASNSTEARDAGYDVIDTTVLPPDVWWTSLYEPLRVRIESLRAEAETDANLARVIAESEREMEVFKTGHVYYGYVFFILRRPGEG